MLMADFSITSASTKLIDQGDATQAPEKDFKGVSRKGAGPDIGAYEYDPDAIHVDVTGVSILQDSIKIIVGKTGTLVAQVEPSNADNKRVSWSIDDPTVATIQNGKVTALREDTTFANTGVGGLSLLQGILPTQGSNLHLLHCRWIPYHLSHQGSP